MIKETRQLIGRANAIQPLPTAAPSAIAGQEYKGKYLCMIIFPVNPQPATHPILSRTFYLADPRALPTPCLFPLPPDVRFLCQIRWDADRAGHPGCAQTGRGSVARARQKGMIFLSQADILLERNSA
jgi:hypothetical protein